MKIIQTRTKHKQGETIVPIMKGEIFREELLLF